MNQVFSPGQTPTATGSAATSAAVLVRVLEAQGVRRVFTGPGAGMPALVEALGASRLATVACRHEGGAATMAEASGKLTGRPGIAFVGGSLGAAHAAAGVTIAAEDSSPMILFVGQVERAFRGRGASGDADCAGLFGTIAKWAVELEDPQRTVEIVARAFQVATSGRPGPVVIALPADVLGETVAAGPIIARETVETHPGLTQMAALQKRLWASERPIAILGGSRWSAAAAAAFQRFAARFDLPVAVSSNRQALFDHLHPNYAGDLGPGANPALVERIRSADLVLLVGGRLLSASSGGYAPLDGPEPGPALVHVHPDPEELGRVYRPSLAINASPTGFAAAIEGLQPPNSIRWSDWTRTAGAAYRAWSDEVPEAGGPVDIGAVIRLLGKRLPDTAIVTHGNGAFIGWIRRFHRFRAYGTQAASSALGYGLAAAIAARLEQPGVPVVAFMSGNGFEAAGQDLGTAVQAKTAVVVIVVDDGLNSTGPAGTGLIGNGLAGAAASPRFRPDFAALARAYGAFGETVRTTEAFAPAFERALEGGGPALLHLVADAGMPSV